MIRFFFFFIHSRLLTYTVCCSSSLQLFYPYMRIFDLGVYNDLLLLYIWLKELKSTTASSKIYFAILNIFVFFFSIALHAYYIIHTDFNHHFESGCGLKNICKLWANVSPLLMWVLHSAGVLFKLILSSCAPNAHSFQLNSIPKRYLVYCCDQSFWAVFWAQISLISTITFNKISYSTSAWWIIVKNIVLHYVHLWIDFKMRALALALAIHQNSL